MLDTYLSTCRKKNLYWSHLVAHCAKSNSRDVFRSTHAVRIQRQPIFRGISFTNGAGKLLTIKKPKIIPATNAALLSYHSYFNIILSQLICLLQSSQKKSRFPFWVRKECLCITLWRGTHTTARYEKTCQRCQRPRAGFPFAELRNSNTGIIAEYRCGPPSPLQRPFPGQEPDSYTEWNAFRCLTARALSRLHAMLALQKCCVSAWRK